MLIKSNTDRGVTDGRALILIKIQKENSNTKIKQKMQIHTERWWKRKQFTKAIKIVSSKSFELGDLQKKQDCILQYLTRIAPNC